MFLKYQWFWQVYRRYVVIYRRCLGFIDENDNLSTICLFIKIKPGPDYQPETRLKGLSA